MQRDLKKKWSVVHFGEVTLATDTEQHVFEVQVYFDDLDAASLRVELYANGVDGAPPERVDMTQVRQLVGAINGYAYCAKVPASRPVTDYTARVIPHCENVAVPLEAAQILWQR